MTVRRRDEREGKEGQGKGVRLTEKKESGLLDFLHVRLFSSFLSVVSNNGVQLRDMRVYGAGQVASVGRVGETCGEAGGG